MLQSVSAVCLMLKAKRKCKSVPKILKVAPTRPIEQLLLRHLTFSFRNCHLYRVPLSKSTLALWKPPSSSSLSPPSSCFQMRSFEAMMPHLSYVSKESPCAALLNYWILLMPAPVGQEEEQVGGSQCDQSTWNIQFWIYTSFTAAGVRKHPPPKQLLVCFRWFLD